MSRVPNRARMFREHQLFADLKSAPIDIMAEKLGVEPEAMRDAVIEIAKAGYVIAPREPTNAMLVAYLESYGQTASNVDSVIIALGKARLRWKAMADSGMRASLRSFAFGKDKE